MLSLTLASQLLMGAAFLAVAVTIIAAIYRQVNLHPRFRTAVLLFAAGMILVTVGIVAPIVLPDVSDTPFELLIRLTPPAVILMASAMAWPFVRQAAQHKKLLASLSETQLLLLERDDLAAAKTQLEKELVKGAYQLERANRQMRLALLGSPITIFHQNNDGEYTWIFNAPAHADESAFIGKTDHDVFSPEVALTISEIKKAAIKSGEEQSAEVRVSHPHATYWYMLRTQPDYDEYGHIIGTLSCAVDITAQKRDQSRQELLMREVTHRSKNLLAVLQSIVRQTALRTKDIDVFVAQLTARLQAIAKSHDLLVNDDWSGTSMQKLFEGQLAVLSEVGSDRIRLDGPDILLTAVAVQNLGLAFHELATNAAKYGALSEADGHIEIGWSLQPGGAANGSAQEEAMLRLVWREVGGPPVEASEESGFGRMLLERVVGQALGGQVALDFAREGLVCTMLLPVSRTVADGSADPGRGEIAAAFKDTV